MKARIIMMVLATSLILVAVLVASQKATSVSIAVRPSLEDRLLDGSVYNPSTQSFLRGHHLLESIERIELVVDRPDQSSLMLVGPDGDELLTVKGLSLQLLVPRLHYRAGERAGERAAGPPDDFDAYNLMLAEYARVGLSVPVGKASDTMAHFETDSLRESVPWILKDDYTFVPNPVARPVRFSVINNCLAPGLWELSASDRTGEIYHAWFNFPKDLYIDLIAQTNGIDRSFVSDAIQWKSQEVELKLDRLRRVKERIGQASLSLIKRGDIGFSSQDSRRKLHKHFVQVFQDGQWTDPTELDQLTALPSRFSNFVSPGKYSIQDRKQFDFDFLRQVKAVDVSRVESLTRYDWMSHDPQKSKDSAHSDCLELLVGLADESIVIGNLPLSLLVPQEDFVINGFGVGILSSSGIAERQRYLIDEGPPPSFAYLYRHASGRMLGLNSHDYGIEQIFIRTHIDDSEPWWEITVTSYERIVDIVKYRVEIPDELHEPLRQAARRYVSPLYRTYRDDNLR